MRARAVLCSLYTFSHWMPRMNGWWKELFVLVLKNWVWVKFNKLLKVTELVSRNIRIPSQAGHKAVDLMLILPKSISYSPALYFWPCYLWVKPLLPGSIKPFSQFLFISDDFSSDSFLSSTSSSSEANCTFLLGWLHPVSTTLNKPSRTPTALSWGCACLKPDCSPSSQTTFLHTQAWISEPLLTPALLLTFHH